MVTAFTGVLTLFRDFGLSAAAVQRPTVTNEQMSTLFWINILLGALLGLVSVAMAPSITAFYHEPQLVGVTIVLAAGFIFNAVGVQHAALLQRQMRFTVLAVVNVVSLIVGTAIAIGGAKSRLRILVPCSDDGHTAPYCHYRLLADGGLGPRDATGCN